MNCKKCGLELNTKMIRKDGVLECVYCGAQYRRKRAVNAAYGRQFAADTSSRLQAAASRAGEIARSAGEAVSDMRLGEKLDRAAKSAGKAAADLGIPEKLGDASRATGRFLSGLNKKTALSLVFVILVVIGGFGIGYRMTAQGTGGFTIFESREQKGAKDLLKRLEKAYNAMDVYAILQVYDPTYTDAMFGMMDLFGIDGDALKSLLPFASQFLSQHNSTDTGTVKLTLQKLSVDGTRGKLTYQVDMKFKDGTKESLTDTASIVKVDGKWYFAAY